MAENQRDKIAKIENILERIKNYGLTSYQLSKYSQISITGIEKILDGKTANPNDKTISKLEEALDYHESVLKNDPVTLNTINEKLDLILDKMRILEIDQDMLFEIIKNSPVEGELKNLLERKSIHR